MEDGTKLTECLQSLIQVDRSGDQHAPTLLDLPCGSECLGARIGVVIDIGEDLVGAYLSRIKQCQIVQYNVRTGREQAEIDVVGMCFEHGHIKQLWLCEVSTHTGGLGGYGGDVAGKFRKKIASVKAYADTEYPGIARSIEIWLAVTA